MTTLDQHFAVIAREQLGISTLTTRNSDSLDFHSVAVWQVRRALEAAYHLARSTPADSTAPCLPADDGIRDDL